MAKIAGPHDPHGFAIVGPSSDCIHVDTMGPLIMILFVVSSDICPEFHDLILLGGDHERFMHGVRGSTFLCSEKKWKCQKKNKE
jgi:hypothetical protein